MATCRFDTKTSSKFRKLLVKLFRKHPKAEGELKSLSALIESDVLHRKTCATRLVMPHYPDLQGKVYKYDFDADGSPKHGRCSHRIVAMFLDDTTTLYAVHLYPRPNNDYVSAKEMAELMRDLRADIASPAFDDVDDIEASV